jgi:parvulin-like peptidyl-prolyl isomerase
MSFRSRPVLDRKHRPRWQDELRTQQLTIVGFAVAIALALGIFGAAAWNGYWESHLRAVAAVGQETFDQSDLGERQAILTAEAVSRVTELQAQLTGGLRDQIVQQQIDSLNQGFSNVAGMATASLTDQAVLEDRASAFDVSVSESEVDAEVASRYSLPERVQANLILIDALPEDAGAEDEPTEEQLAAATDAAQEAKDRVENGEEFADVATEVSDDFTAQSGGGLGWFQADDPAYAEYFDVLVGADDGDLVGPVEVEGGVAVLQLVDRREATADGGLHDILKQAGVSDESYRDYVRGVLMNNAFRTHFEDDVVTSPAPQQRVAQIFIAPQTGTVVPEERARHILIQPDPDLEDQAEATNEQWDAALAEAREVEDLVGDADADWWAIAEDHSDDSGSAERGGDLGWYDPANPGFVTAFAAELAALDVDEISEPIRTEFGYHVIQKTGERDSPDAQAADLVQQLRDDPDSFGDIAKDVSEDYDTANDDGELGWVAPYQLPKANEDAVFGLTEVGDISDPVGDAAAGITIYKLLETSDSREIEEDRLDEIRSGGFERWLDDEVRSSVEVWIDPQFAPSTTTAGA